MSKLDDAPVEPARGIPSESIVFYVLGVFALVIDIIYVVMGVVSGEGVEWAGTIGLAAAAIFSLFLGAFLQRDLRRVQDDVEALEEAVQSGELAEDSPHALYLPETSVWPLGIGVGAGLTFAGLGFGWWFMIPGVALLVNSAIGFARQSRERQRY